MSPAKPAKATDGSRHLRVAEEFLAAAKDSLDAGRRSPAVSDAVVAAIRASDAVCAVELRQTWHGLDHGGATALPVRTSLGTHGAGLLAALLPEKNKGQYTLMPIHEPRARSAYQQASELVDLAAAAIRRAGQTPG
jgi:hypothetical protein